CAAIGTCLVSIVLFVQLHAIAINYIYTQPTTDYNIIGMSEKDEKKAMEVTEQDNKILDQFKGNLNASDAEIRRAIERLDSYEEAEEGDIDTALKRIKEKLAVINTEYLQWFEILLSFVFAVVAYMAPIWILMFQV